MNKRLRII